MNIFRRVRYLLIIPVIVLLLLVTRCANPQPGGGVYFDLYNQTPTTISVWAVYERCASAPGNSDDYYRTEEVLSGATIYYSSGSGGTPWRVQCIQAVDSERRLIFSQPYEHGSYYVVSDSTPISPTPVPALTDLEKQSWLRNQEEFAREHTWNFLLAYAFIFFFAGMFLVGLPFGVLRSVEISKARRDERAARMRTDAEDQAASTPPELWR
jgi:hypothetical protein